MVWEVAELTIIPGQEAAFEAAVAKAVPHFKAMKSCHGLELRRIVERPGIYWLVVEWESVEAHMVDFRNSPNFAEWRRLVGSFFQAPPKVEHAERALLGF